MNTSKTKDKKKKVVVVGTGHKARGLAHMYQAHAKKEGWLELVYTEPLFANKVEPFDEYALGVYPDTLTTADIVVLCIPSYALDSFLIQNLNILKEDCILVDLVDSSSSQGKKDLKASFDNLGVGSNRWENGFVTKID